MILVSIPSLPDAVVSGGLLLVALGGILGTAVLYVLLLGRYLWDHLRWIDGSDTDRLRPNGWWTILFLLPAVTLLYYLVLLADPYTRLLYALPFEGIVALVLAFLGVHLVAPVAFHFDSKRVERRFGWRPSSVYYLVVVWFLGPLLAAHYLLARYDRTRRPSSATDSGSGVDSTGEPEPASNQPRSTWGPPLTRRDVFKLGSVAYVAYLGYQFLGGWATNQVKKLLFGSPPSFEFSPTGWPMPYFDPQRTNAKSASDPPLDGLQLEPLRTDLGDLDEGIAAIADGTAYVLGETEMYAITIDSGEIQWRYREKYRHSTSFDDRQWAVPYQIATDGDSVFVSINLGLSSVDAATGEQTWHYDEGSLFRQLGFAGNTAFFNSHGITAVDATIGVPRWSHTWTTGPEVSAAYDDGLVFTGHNLSIEDGNHEWVLLAFDARSGEEVWRRRIDTGSEWSASNMPVANGRTYYGGKNLFAVDAKTGSVVWDRPNVVAGEHAAKLVTDGQLLVVSSSADTVEADTSYLQAFDAATGTSRWSQQLESDFLDPVLVGEYLYVTLENELRVYEAKSGELISNLEDDVISGRNPPQVLTDAIVLKEHWGLYRIVSE